MTNENREFFKEFDKPQQKDLRALAKKLLDDSQSFFDKYDGFGCSIGDIIELVAQLADDIMWKECDKSLKKMNATK